MKHLNACINRLISEKTVSSLAIRVGLGDKILLETCRSSHGDVSASTLFDMASVTKIVATTSLTLIAFDRGLLSVDDPISRFFPCPEDKKGLTIQHLLTHTLGIGHKPLNLPENNYGNIGEKILQIPCDIPVGSDVLYSCPAFILLGKILEKLYGMPLNKAFLEFVARPLEMNDSSFLPDISSHSFVNSNMTDDRLAIVNDYNCYFLGGVAGNAGLFSNLNDMTKYVKMLRNYGAPLIQRETFCAAIANYTANLSESRGLGFLFVDARYPQTGKLFAEGSIGHCGHTGQSVFVDLRTGLYVILLSDATRTTIETYGNEDYGLVIQMREDLHNAILADLTDSGLSF